MSRIDEPVDRGSVYEVAGRVLDHHANGGVCQSCRPDDCPETQWALEQVFAVHASRARARR